MVEKRIGWRRRVLKGAIIAFNQRHSTLPCSVTNLSSDGCRVEALVSGGIPDTFELIIELDGLEANCEVVWRQLKMAGVRFTEPPKRTSARRLQIVRPTRPAKKVSLRRAKRA